MVVVEKRRQLVYVCAWVRVFVFVSGMHTALHIMGWAYCFHSGPCSDTSRSSPRCIARCRWNRPCTAARWVAQLSKSGSLPSRSAHRSPPLAGGACPLAGATKERCLAVWAGRKKN